MARLLRTSRDINGNKTLKIPSRGHLKGFSVQTLGNLPITHRDGVTEGTMAELAVFINEHGTEHQKRVVIYG